MHGRLQYRPAHLRAPGVPLPHQPRSSPPVRFLVRSRHSARSRGSLRTRKTSRGAPPMYGSRSRATTAPAALPAAPSRRDLARRLANVHVPVARHVYPVRSSQPDGLRLETRLARRPCLSEHSRSQDLSVRHGARSQLAPRSRATNGFSQPCLLRHHHHASRGAPQACTVRSRNLSIRHGARSRSPFRIETRPREAPRHTECSDCEICLPALSSATVGASPPRHELREATTRCRCHTRTRIMNAHASPSARSRAPRMAL